MKSLNKCGDALTELRSKGETMKSLDNHKGKPCPYKPLTCQEGYCSECNIYLQWVESLKALWY